MKGLRIAAVAASMLFASVAYPQSSKFAATYDTDPVMIEVSVNGDTDPAGLSCVDVDPDGVPASGDEYPFCVATAGPVAEAEVASLHVANWKEILGSMSSQINLVTFTQAKGKNGGGVATAVAEGTVRGGMLILAEGTGSAGQCAASFAAVDAGAGNPFAAPGPVTLAARRQELAVTVDLDVVGAIDGVCDADCIEDSLGIEGSVTVALGLDTTAAHSFQFVADDLSSGTYDVVACYDLTALAGVGGDDIDEDTAAYSKVVLGPRIITAQEVRATKTGIIDESGSNN